MELRKMVCGSRCVLERCIRVRCMIVIGLTRGESDAILCCVGCAKQARLSGHFGHKLLKKPSRDAWRPVEEVLRASRCFALGKPVCLRAGAAARKAALNATRRRASLAFALQK